jgi:hypothetical protein
MYKKCGLEEVIAIEVNLKQFRKEGTYRPYLGARPPDGLETDKPAIANWTWRKMERFR